MRHNRVFLDEKNEPLISFYLYNQGSDNRAERERMKRLINLAIRYELTDRQRYCLKKYYLDGIKMTEIAQSLSLSKSTVSKHISAAVRKLQKVGRYL